MQFLVVVRHGLSDAEFYLTIIAVPVTVVLLLLAAWFTQRESYFGQFCVICIYFAAMAYFVFKLVRMYTPPMDKFYLSARHSLTTFAVLTLLLLVVTIVVAIACMRNFNKGLRPHVQRSSRRFAGAGDPDADPTKHGPAGYDSGYHPGAPHMMTPVGGGSRMEID